MIGTLAFARPKKRVFLGLMLVTKFVAALMQAPGSKKMSAADYLKGHRLGR